ncbi:MAG: hypothetical protein NZV14_19970 [Bryobacteraceae bacterium]|nr:hypothetical protein [Bryobacteraceae bacterium]MDW8380443.1 hypothetical protein [Bryobacterales bacterium]
MQEQEFFTESKVFKPADLICAFCKTRARYELPWVVRKKKSTLPPRAREDDLSRFEKLQSYMVLAQDQVACKHCHRLFDVSGIKTLALLEGG